MPHIDDLTITRRSAAALLGGAFASVPFGQTLAQSTDAFRGGALFADVAVYDAPFSWQPPK